jgi:hypothetical protein
MRVSTSTVSKGLPMKSRAPASSAASFLSGSAVTTSTGSQDSRSSGFKASITWKPSMKGICRSRMIRSYWFCRCSAATWRGSVVLSTCS